MGWRRVQDSRALGMERIYPSMTPFDGPWQKRLPQYLGTLVALMVPMALFYILNERIMKGGLGYDEQFFAWGGWSITQGLRPYIDFFEFKPPMVFITHAFANWTAQLGQGLCSWLRSLEYAAALIDEGYGIRHADLILRHLADPRLFAAVCATAEDEPPRGGLTRRS